MGQAFKNRRVYLSGMFEVDKVAVPNQFVDFLYWNADKVVRNVYLGGYCDRPMCEGDAYLMTIQLEDGIWRIIDCGPRQDEVYVDLDMDSLA